MPGRIILFAAALSVAILALAPAAQGADDIIYRKKGSEMPNVEVTEENIKTIKFKIFSSSGSAVPQEMDAKKVARVEYGNKPLAWEQAESARKSNMFSEALTQYDKCTRLNRLEYPWLVQYALFGMAETNRAWADCGNTAKYAEAIAGYQKLLKVKPNTIHLFSANLGIANCLLAMGKVADAANLFNEVMKANYDKKYVILAKIGQAKILELNKKFREARHKYHEIASEARSLAMSDPSAKDIPNQALVREGACLVGLRKYDDALGFFQDIIKKAESDSVLASAYNGLGDSYYAKRQLEQAMWSYLKVAIVFEHVTSEAPKAFYFASLCMRNLAAKMQDDKAKEWSNRGKSLLGELRRKFRGSPYASRK